MKTNTSLLLAGLLFSGLVGAQTITEKNIEQATAIIDAAVAAHGGELGLDSLNTLVVKHESINFAVDQSRGTEPPWDANEASGVDAIDMANSIFVSHNINNGGSFQSDNKTIINDAESYQLNYRSGTIAKISEPDYDTTSGPLIRITSTLLVKALQARSGNAYYLGESEINGTEYDVIGFSMAVGPAISLYFDKEDHLLRRSERVVPNFGLVQYEFENYKNIDGVPFSHKFMFYFNGDKNIERTTVSAKFNQPLDSLVAMDDSLQTIPELTPDELSRQEVADGVWLIGGNGTYAMFVDMGEYIFAAGATAGIPDRIESLREVVADKPIKYAMLTHHHFDHVMGVSAYESEGATVIAAKAHETIARRAATSGDTLHLQTVRDRMQLKTDDRVVDIIDIGPTAHTEHLLVAYLPEEGILFEADHFSLPRVGPIPPAVTSTQSFAEALAREELVVKQMLSAHSPRVATPDDLRTALEAKIHQASL